ncbi:outer membrane protein [Pseudaminobacter soli (ex Li et al. 2025)]|uniref:Porin family protein n=1 Tax=Pseudaminobacter soli (ex Li et al. 2025) TaxID=1295366 RepID=A0A2P7S568_9HYPH|nr:outer membrane protein [Mesorhizobium soli]PSJ57613.1 porin family protein [Mesorhizobium soli]
MKSILLAGLAVFTLTGSAVAADVVVQEPVAAYNWSGFYVGAQVGYAWGKSPFRNRSDDYVEGTDFDPRGFFGGVYGGYNQQLSNNIVLGVDADINAADIKRNGGDYYDYTDGSVYDYVSPSSKMNWNGAVRARVGYAYDRVLPYIAGGVSFGELKFDLIHKNYGDVKFSEKATMTGWNIGAGIEYAATDNVILRAEYRYTDFGSKTFHGLWFEDEGRIKLRTNDIRIGVAYKF